MECTTSRQAVAPAAMTGARYADPAAAGWYSSGGGSGGGGSGGGGSGGSARGEPEDWEEAELALLSPESQKRERRRIANRDCARRIRQRKSELLAELSATVAELQADNTRLLATLSEATRRWRDTTLENCSLRSQLVLLEAGMADDSSGGGAAATATGIASPPLDAGLALAQQLQSPPLCSQLLL